MNKSNPKLLQGTLDMLVLKALWIGPMHGYGIAQRIAQLSDKVLTVEEGSLYPAVYRLQQQGWIKSEWRTSENNQRARYYALTRSGRRQLELERDNWRRLSGAITRVLRTT